MSTLQQIREGVHHAWDSLLDGWQHLYHKAAGAITRFEPGRKSTPALAGAGEGPLPDSASWGVMAADVFDDRDRIVVRLEAPGMKKGDFDLQVIDNYLVVRGEKQVQREETRGSYHVTECAYGRFERAIPLPEAVRSDKARARYKRGVLRVELPKVKPRRKKRIAIEGR